MKIWGPKSVGNTLRVAVFVSEKGLDIPFVPVDLLAGGHRLPDFVAKNPIAQVPVLELDDGTCISETIAICRYLERLHPDPALMGIMPRDEAIIEMWQRRVELQFCDAARAIYRHTVPYMKVLEPVQIEAWAEINRSRFRDILHLFEKQLQNHRYLAGDEFSVADITALFGFWLMKAGQIEMPQSCPSVLNWRNDLMARPSVISVMS